MIGTTQGLVNLSARAEAGPAAAPLNRKGMFYHENYRFDYRPPEPGEQAVAGGGVPGLRVAEQQADRYRPRLPLYGGLAGKGPGQNQCAH